MSTHFQAGTQRVNWYEKHHPAAVPSPNVQSPKRHSSILQKRKREITITEMEKKGSLTQTKTP